MLLDMLQDDQCKFEKKKSVKQTAWKTSLKNKYYRMYCCNELSTGRWQPCYVKVNTLTHSHNIFLFTSISVMKNSKINVGLLRICCIQHTK